jgi:hypothetical protein
VFFFEKLLENCCFYKKKIQMSFIIIQKFNEKLTKAKKNSNPACTFFYFYFIFTSFIFFENTPKITKCEIFAPPFSGVKKTHNFFFSKHRTVFF